MTAENKTYQGWTNYETWAVNLWIENEKGEYDHWRSQAESMYREVISDTPDRDNDTRSVVWTLAGEMKIRFDTDSDIWDTVSGLYADLLNAALSEVNWDEIATSFVEGIDREGIEREEIGLNAE